MVNTNLGTATSQTEITKATRITKTSKITKIVKIMTGATRNLEDKATGGRGLSGMANNREEEARKYAGRTRMDKATLNKANNRTEMWQDQSGGEADLDTSDSDDVLVDAPPLQQEPTTQPYFSEENDRPRRRQSAGFGPRDQTVQAWEQQQQQSQQSHPMYNEWVQGHGHILKEGVDSWEQIQRYRVEEQRESLYHLYCETEKARRLARQQEPKQRRPWHDENLPPQYQGNSVLQSRESSPPSYRENSLPPYRETSLPPYQECTPSPPTRPAEPFPQPTTQPPPPQQRPTQPPLPPPHLQPQFPPLTTHPQKILQLLLYTTALQQALQTTFTLLTTHETHTAHAQQRTPDLTSLCGFFDAIGRTVTRTAERLDGFWRTAQRADANGGEFRLAGRAAQVEFCAAWEGVLWGYVEVRRLEEVVFGEGQGSFWRPAAAEGLGEGWGGYVRALERFGEVVGGFGGRLV
ncbi:uncharacterized protein B0H64DRAFT_453180 [Chaetomium fimeti]|uniref:Uncharacterized protein n=1 Tax=Chaetomium fimeti TaxID=1854472 RepID=A0AAE0H575_9PEZI|nr:hypothetical protein B0H64DRAFT_453180 [Chaetomium fimeti]